MSKQPACKMNTSQGTAESKLGQQVGYYVVVVSRIKRHVTLTPAIGKRTGNVQRMIAVEWRYLDRHHILDLKEFAPEP